MISHLFGWPLKPAKSKSITVFIPNTQKHACIENTQIHGKEQLLLTFYLRVIIKGKVDNIEMLHKT
jgi:hypothetical protein